MKVTMLQNLKSKCKLSKIIRGEQAKDLETEHLWLRESFTREQTESFLADKEIGIFVVRKSESNKNCHVLSIKVPKYMNISEVSHYLIVKTKEGHCIKGLNKHFDDLKSLITHCSMLRDMIPILLNLDYYRSLVKHEPKKTKSNIISIFTSTSSLASTLSSTSDFSEEYLLDESF